MRELYVTELLVHTKWTDPITFTSYLKLLWWDYVKSGPTVCVPWPNGWTRWPHSPTDALVHEQGAYSADPNDHYRPWLEENVGRQGYDWDWDIDTVEYDKLFITVSKQKKQFASIIALQWA